jgi:hypothetical protein
MHSFQLRKILVASTVAVLAAACGGASDPVAGTWNQPNGSIAIPASLGGGSVDSNNTLVFDDSVSPHAFTLTMDLSFAGLTDSLVAQGTYADNGGALALTFTGFLIDQSTGDTQSVGDGGSQCITLNALAGATVCFQTPQTATFSIQSDTLSIAIDNEIVGGPMQPTTLTLTRTN